MILPASSGNHQPQSRETILIVDDEPLIRQVGEAVLSREGYRVLLAEDGLEALEVYRRQGNVIDLVILDVSMPRLSGPETLRRLANLDPGIRLLISTGYGPPAAPPGGCPQVLGVVQKPYRVEQLVARVHEALEYRRARQRELRRSREAELLPWAAQGG